MDDKNGTKQQAKNAKYFGDEYKDKTIIGIDFATNLGYCVTKDNQIIDQGRITASKHYAKKRATSGMPEGRIENILDTAQRLIDEVITKYNPSLVMLEDLDHVHTYSDSIKKASKDEAREAEQENINPIYLTTPRVIGHGKGVIKLYLQQNNIPWGEVNNFNVKLHFKLAYKTDKGYYYLRSKKIKTNDDLKKELCKRITSKTLSLGGDHLDCNKEATGDISDAIAMFIYIKETVKYKENLTFRDLKINHTKL